MTLVTGTVQDLGYDGMEGTLWARPARFRSDGQVVYAPERKPYKVVDGVVSADLAPGPAVLELQVGSHARGTFEVVIPEEDTTLADLLDTVFAWEPAQVSLFVAEREAAELAKMEAEAAAGQATTAAQQTGQDRSHVDQVRTLLDETYDESQAGMALPPRLAKTALNATYESTGVAVQVVETAYDVHRSGAVGNGLVDDRAALAAAMSVVGPKGAIRLRPGRTYDVGSTLPAFEGIVDARGATVRAAAGTSGSMAIINQSGKSPLTWLGGTFDGNKQNRPPTSNTTATSVEIVDLNDTDGWTTATVFVEPTFINHAIIPFRAGAYRNNQIPTDEPVFDAMRVPWAPVHLLRPVVNGGFYGISARLMAGWVCESPQIQDTDGSGAEDMLTAFSQWIGGTVRNAGRGPTKGHGWVTTYSAYPTYSGCVSLNASDIGLCSGGGMGDKKPGYGVRWINTLSYGSEVHGYAVDTTLSSSNAKQVVHGQAVAAQAVNSGTHGFYLQHTDGFAISGLTSRGSGHTGLMLNARNVTVASSTITENSTGIHLAGSSVGENGSHRIGRDVHVYGNGTDWNVGAHGAAGTSLDLQGNPSTFGNGQTPESNVIAPIGSTYHDTTTGDMWVKTAWVPGNTTTYKTGWKKVATDTAG